MITEASFNAFVDSLPPLENPELIAALAAPFDWGKPDAIDKELCRFLVCLPALIAFAPRLPGLRGEWPERFAEMLKWRLHARGVPSIEEFRADWTHDIRATKVIANIWADAADRICATLDDSDDRGCPRAFLAVVSKLELRAEAEKNARERSIKGEVCDDQLRRAAAIAKARALRKK